MTAGLLSLQALSSSSSTGAVGAGAGAGRGATATAPEAGGVEEGAESEGARALRLAALPTWRLLDAPNAFQEAFACAVLVMEAAQTAGTRSPRPLRVRNKSCAVVIFSFCFRIRVTWVLDGFWTVLPIVCGACVEVPSGCRFRFFAVYCSMSS